jgi:S-adenosylmethionine-dependent carboxyl methyltransferase
MFAKRKETPRMLTELTPFYGTMEKSGSYNKHAYVPASGATLALPLLQNAARSVALDAEDHPVVVADYGSSQGKNSLLAMQVAIKTLRDRLGLDRPISVVHIDQPSNDFNTLFEVLDADPGRYVLDDPNVFPSAIGRSFYENVLPPGSVHLGWSSYSAMWPSRLPSSIPGHFMSIRSTGTVRAEFDRQAAQDWESFLSLRAKELRPGARLVVVLPGLSDDGWTGLEPLFDHANAALGEMAEQGAITASERAAMVVGAYPRRERDVLAPFAGSGTFQCLAVEAVEVLPLQDAAWSEYERNRNKEALASKRALFFRSVFTPSLGSALTHVQTGGTEALRIFGDCLEASLKRQLATHLAAMHSLVQVIVLAKRGS